MTKYRRRPHHSRFGALLAAALVLFALPGGCEREGPLVSGETWTLQLLHASNGEAGGAAVEDAPRFSAVLSSLRAEMPERTLVVSSGDNWIPGPFSSAGGDGALQALLGAPGEARADVAMLSAMGFAASAFGNHEFDLGPETVKSAIAREEIDEDEDGTVDHVYEGAAFPYLSANLDLAGDEELGPLVAADGQPAEAIAGRVARSAVVEVAGRKVGLVGATTPSLRAISSPGDDIEVLPADVEDRTALAAVIQSAVDELSAAGVDLVVLLSHMQQIGVEKELAPLLRDVDVIVAGSSNTILADASDRLRAGDSAADTYPIVLSSASEEPVLLVNTDGNYRYVGRLVVAFDSEGRVLPESVVPEVSGAFATDAQGVADLGDPEPQPEVSDLAGAVFEVLAERDSAIFGRTEVYLNGERGSVRTEETNLGSLAADAALATARPADPETVVALLNGGGIRASIGLLSIPPGATGPEAAERLPPAANPATGRPEGAISRHDIENTLRFNNDYAILSLSAEELLAVVEHGVAATAPGATPGRFPQVAGMSFSFDPEAEAGKRVRSLAVLDSAGAVADELVVEGKLRGDPTRSIRLVTTSFLAGGGDGYPFPSNEGDTIDLSEAGLHPGEVDFAAPGTEQHALAAYLLSCCSGERAFGVADVPAAQDARIQDISRREDRVFGAGD